MPTHPRQADGDSGQSLIICSAVFTDADLEAAIRTYIDSYNDRATPFTWTKTADQLLDKINRKSINNTKHWRPQLPPRARQALRLDGSGYDYPWDPFADPPTHIDD